MLAPPPRPDFQSYRSPLPRRHSSSPPFRGGVEISWNKHL